MHGNMTHYISSITLGAMEYTVETCEERNLNRSLGGGVDIPIGGVMKVDIDSTQKNTWDAKDNGMIGTISEDGITAKVKGVIFCKHEPLTNLITDEDLKKCLDKAISQYMEKDYLAGGK